MIRKNTIAVTGVYICKNILFFSDYNPITTNAPTTFITTGTGTGQSRNIEPGKTKQNWTEGTYQAGKTFTVKALPFIQSSYHYRRIK